MCSKIHNKEKEDVSLDVAHNVDGKGLGQEVNDTELLKKVDGLVNDEKFLAQLAQSDKKIVAADHLNEGLKNNLVGVVEELKNLHDEVANKKQDVLSRSHSIKERVELLVQAGKVHIDQDEYAKSEVSVVRYADLLDGIGAELQSEINYFSLFLGDNRPKHIIAQKNSSDVFDSVMQEKVKTIKRYLKTIKRDLSVSYSRYCFGFDSQIKRINYIEAMLKNKPAT